MEESRRTTGLRSSDARELVVDAALQYASFGWLVHPVGPDKAPATSHGFKDASVDPERIRELWRQSRGRGLGVRTGRESGLVVLDIDPDKGGDDSLAELEERYGELPESVEALTGGGGRHIYLAHPGGTIRCSAGRLGPGVDVRADGGYVVAPPSPHPSGRRYEWEVSHHPEDVELAPLPTWLFELLSGQSGPVTSPEVEHFIEAGRRNTTLVSYAGSMRRRGMTPREIEAGLLVANSDRCRPPLDSAEVARIARGMARYAPENSDNGDAEVGRERELAVMTARELSQIPDPPRDSELLGPLVVRGGRTVIGAHTGEGKTTFALQLVNAAVTYGDFLGWRGTARRALVIDAEQGVRTVKRRLREAHLAESDHVDYLLAPEGLVLDDHSADVMQLEELLEAGGYDVVVADPLYKLHRGDSNDERHAVDLMRRLDEWRTRFEFGLVMLVHRRKHQPGAHGFTIDDLFGSGAYLRGAEVVLGLRRPSPGYAHLHFFKDRDGDLPVGERWGLIFDRGDGFRRDPEDGKPKETALDKVKRALEDRGALTKAELAKATGYTERTVGSALKDLDAEHDRGPNGVKRWRLSTANDKADT